MLSLQECTDIYLKYVKESELPPYKLAKHIGNFFFELVLYENNCYSVYATTEQGKFIQMVKRGVYYEDDNY